MEHESRKELIYPGFLIILMFQVSWFMVKTCQNCKQEFPINERDFNFLRQDKSSSSYMVPGVPDDTAYGFDGLPDFIQREMRQVWERN